ncbi:hypothetical protein Tsubulata_049672 [Turnera subulata]|uniref:DUF4219 domain-containing protein n=1 Tax=Turnera subulata TaxID=218843 RepID=A0A9Q0F7B3_9ROSI|nr:hypothetical protein Tsubulata_049672 [Turnera subulata]
MGKTTTRVVPNSIILLEDLEADTYENWKACMMTYLEAQDLWDVIDHDPNNSYADEADRNKDCSKSNAAALLAIQASCAPEILAKVRNIRSAKLVWNTLAHMKEQEQKQGYSGQEEEEEEEKKQEHEKEKESKQRSEVIAGRLDSRGLPELEQPNEGIFVKERSVGWDHRVHRSIFKWSTPKSNRL